MIGGWGKLALVHGILASLFIGLLLTNNTNMFTLPVASIFTMSTIYCFMQYEVNKMFKKLEAKYSDKA